MSIARTKERPRDAGTGKGAQGVRPDTEDLKGLPEVDPEGRFVASDRPGLAGHTSGAIRPPSLADAHLEDPYLGRILAGRYALVERLGMGSSGLVYRARCNRIARDFAVKVVSIATSDPEDAITRRQRLQSEVCALSRLSSPHIVRIYEVLQIGPDTVGIVMEVVRGRTLAEILQRKGTLSVERALALTRQLAQGLYAAHEVQITHCDLKPANIMVERLPLGGEFVHILDFGTVKPSGEMPVLRRFHGTPLFASPEQVRADPVDQRTDIYSLGAILFTMLTGSPPFEGERSMTILMKHLGELPPLLGARAGRAFPERLEQLVAWMLEKNPAHRPQSLFEVIREIDLV